MYDIVGKRRWYFVFSALITIPGLIFILAGGLKPSIDFTGGTTWDVSFASHPTVAQVHAALIDLGHPEATVTAAAGGYLTIRTEPIDLIRTSATLIIVGELFILGYLWIRFGFRFGTAAIVALLHDVIVVVGTFAILGYFLGMEFDALFVTALLTIIGFSVHDTIVVFDRIRENRLRHAGEPFGVIVNHSILQTLGRSINTSMTVLVTLTALLLLGPASIRTFTLALLIGVVSGKI